MINGEPTRFCPILTTADRATVILMAQHLAVGRERYPEFSFEPTIEMFDIDLGFADDSSLTFHLSAYPVAMLRIICR
jgi:hypothetical protein